MSADPKQLEDVLEARTFQTLVSFGAPLEEKMNALRLIRHPAIYKQIFRVGEYRRIREKNCYQIVIPGNTWRYGYLDGPIEEPFESKEISFWTCIAEEEGRLKAEFAFPFNALVCLTQ